MSEPTLRLKSPTDLLALVPCVLGFHPQDSLVLVVLAAEGGNLHARVDLVREDVDIDAAVESLLPAVRRVGARTVALVAYTDDCFLAEEAVDELAEALAAVDVEVVIALRAEADRWWALGCEDDAYPSEGSPYDVREHPITAQSVLDGKVTFPSRRALADSLIGSDVDDIEAVAEAADEAMRRFREAAGQDMLHVDGDVIPFPAHATSGARQHLVAEGLWVRDRVRRYLDTREPLDSDEAGRLAVALVNIAVRDVAWSEMTRENAASHVELWRDLVRRTPHDLLAAPAALLAFAAWLSGDGALAWCALDRCQEAEPGYSLAGLLTQALVAAIPPSTWTPVPPEDLPLFAG